MVKQSVIKKIKKLKTGDIIHVKENQKTYCMGYNSGWPFYRTITPHDDITVENNQAPYVFKPRKGMHDCFIFGYVTINNEICPCCISYDNVNL